MSELSLAEMLSHVAQQPVDAKRITGLLTVAATTASLGHGPGVATVTDGVNSATLAWNSTAGKWIEVGQPEVAAVKTAGTATAGTAYAVNQQGAQIPFAAYLTLGLTLEIRLFANLQAGASSTAFAACIVATGNEAGAGTQDTTNQTSEVSTTSVTQVNKASGWNALNANIASADYIALSIGSKRSGVNNGQINSASTLQYRWTYTPS